MRALVTGAAGFIGSSLVDRLLSQGAEVIGVDLFTSYYARERKLSNLSEALDHPKFTLSELDLSDAPLSKLVDGVTHIFHQAGQPGVRSSWGEEFKDYLTFNVLATQRLLEACRSLVSLKSFVAASSSSVYGLAESFPTAEDTIPCPISPYGVTKLAAENLCSLYGTEFGLPTASLRYFTVFGPRQRPDMAFQRIIEALMHEKEFVLNGSGEQVRDFTFVDDVVDANLAAARRLSTSNEPIGAMNIGGGNQASLNEVICSLEQLVGKKLRVSRQPAAPGDPVRTSADCEKAKRITEWEPKVGILDGLRKQIAQNMSEI